MSKKLIGFVLLLALVFTFETTAHAVTVDITNAQVTITGPDKMHMDNVEALGMVFWVDLEWDSSNNVFIPVDFGEINVNSIIGKWELNEDWNCDNMSIITLTITFDEDGTFVDSKLLKGTWIQNGTSVIFTYATGSEYIGTIDGNVMKGTMISFTGATGCWDALRAR